jgi:glycosyltransferase involved in cell wall biosynthesis
MQILVITWNYPPRRGGIENLIGNLCEGLRSKNSVLVITSYGKISSLAERDTFRAPVPGLFPFALYALWRGMLLLTRNRQIHVVFGGSAMVTPLVLTLARVFGRRSVIQTHGLDVFYRNFFYQQLCVRWLKRCDRVVANSVYTGELAESKGLVRARLSVIPPGVHPPRFRVEADVTATKRSWNIEGRKIILFVGRLARRKGIKEFVENSLPKIIRVIPGVCFLVVGENPTESLIHRDDMVAEITAAVAKLGLEDHVRLLGSLGDSQLIELYQVCDLVVLPALKTNDDVEGFGIALLEAAATGLPAVATRVGGIPDAIEDEKSGILVDPDRYDQLSQSVIGLLTDEEKRRGMGEYAKVRVNEKFSWRRIVSCYEAVLSDMVVPNG